MRRSRHNRPVPGWSQGGHDRWWHRPLSFGHRGVPAYRDPDSYSEKLRSKAGTFIVALLLALLPVTSQAAQCAFIPLCLMPFSPPIDGVRIYEGGVLKQDTHPFWFPAGNARTSVVYCTANPNADLKACVYQGTKETCPMVAPPAGAMVPPLCGSTFAMSYKMSGLQTFGQIYANAPATCAKDPACLALLANKCPIDTTGPAGLQVLFDKCVADETCSDALAHALPDVDQDGQKNAGDYYWWDYILGEGRVN